MAAQGLKLWQCVTVNRRAGYIFEYKRSGPRKGKYVVAIPRLGKSVFVSEENLKPRDCSATMRERIREHKQMLKNLDF
jgi:hypothetical protein